MALIGGASRLFGGSESSWEVEGLQGGRKGRGGGREGDGVEGLQGGREERWGRKELKEEGESYMRTCRGEGYIAIQEMAHMYAGN